MSAAIPGRTVPLSKSSDAPPPVDTWLIEPDRPAAATADAPTPAAEGAAIADDL